MKDNGNSIDNVKRFMDDMVLKEMTMYNQAVDELLNDFDLELAIDSDDDFPQEEGIDEKQQIIAEPHCKYTPTVNQFFAGLEKRGMFLGGKLCEKIHTGFRSFDDLFQGWRRGSLSVIAAAPANGLGIFVWNVIGNLVKTQGNNTCAFFSARHNLSCDDLRHIAYNILGCEDSRVICDCDKDEFENIDAWYSELSQEERLKLPSFFYNTTQCPTLQRVEKWVRDLVKNSEINCVFIDSLEEICWAEPNRNEVMKYVCYKLKELAMEFNVAIIVTSELECDYYKKRRPTRQHWNRIQPVLSDLGHNGIIEHVADSVIFLHRPEFYHVMVDSLGNTLENIILVDNAKESRWNTEGCIARLQVDFYSGVISEEPESDSELPF